MIGGQTDNQCKNYTNCIGVESNYFVVNLLVLWKLCVELSVSHGVCIYVLCGL